MGIRLGIERLDVVFRHGKHPASAAGGIVNRFHQMAFCQIFLGGEQQIHHQPDHLARCEVRPGLFGRLLSSANK